MEDEITNETAEELAKWTREIVNRVDSWPFDPQKKMRLLLAFHAAGIAEILGVLYEADPKLAGSAAVSLIKDLTGAAMGKPLTRE